MTESFNYDIENFEMSYERRQNEMRRIMIKIRFKLEYSLEDMAKKLGVSSELLNRIELGYEKISLIMFAKIIEAGGLLEV